jgi:FlaA1/EpsC-like NDP-sugar epimerase
MFKNKTLLITGGTGLIGNAILRKFLTLSLLKYVFLAEMKKAG